VLKQHNLIKNQENVIFSEMSAQRDRHLDALEIITNDLKSIKYELSSKTTYSSILKKDLPQEEISGHHVVIIKPKNDTSKSSETEKLIKTCVSPQKLKIGIRKLKPISKGGVVIECRDDNECEKLIQELSTNKQVSASKPTKTNPKIVIKGVNNTISETEIIDKIIENNKPI
jgi:hypothetical protein